MFSRHALAIAMLDIAKNRQQAAAVKERGHCVVLAGPGSGKTKTLTTAMARALAEDVSEPRGIACITYNNECALELETKLARLGIEPNDRVFIGTVHGFALSQVISPYARCVMPELGDSFRVASKDECHHAVETAYADVMEDDGGDPHERWRFAEHKRRQQVDRTLPIWRERNPALTLFIEAYERELRRRKLIDFDDMPLIAFRMIQAHKWIGNAICARFPSIFVDEYQDLGHGLHELVLQLCFGAGVRLFAVGDPDQSIYAFTDANPRLLLNLTQIPSVRTVSLRFNYRCGTKIISASMAALGEERNYKAPDGTDEGSILFQPVEGEIPSQAEYVATKIVPRLTERGVPLQEIAVLYRNAEHGNAVASAVQAAGLPLVRADRGALVRRSSRLSRFIEACACWVVGGWTDARPRFDRLFEEACALVLSPGASRDERDLIRLELVSFLRASIGAEHTAHSWLNYFRVELGDRWRARSRAPADEWDTVQQMIDRTSPDLPDGDMPLSHFAGRIEGTGRLNLSTLHSAKGREFDAVVLFAMNKDVIPSRGDLRGVESEREARRLFYVGVTRSRRELYIVYRKGQHSPWVKGLFDRIKSATPTTG